MSTIDAAVRILMTEKLYLDVVERDKWDYVAGTGIRRFVRKFGVLYSFEEYVVDTVIYHYNF